MVLCSANSAREAGRSREDWHSCFKASPTDTISGRASLAGTTLLHTLDQTLNFVSCTSLTSSG
jgi:hypothetical protein